MSYVPPPPPQSVIPINYQGQRSCPGCGGGPLKDPGFTWWGGLVGHKILGVERCESCRKWWVKKTGQPGNTRVIVYLLSGFALGALAFFVIFLGRML